MPASPTTYPRPQRGGGRRGHAPGALDRVLGRNLENMEQLKGKKVGVARGSGSEVFWLAMVDKLEAEPGRLHHRQCRGAGDGGGARARQYRRLRGVGALADPGHARHPEYEDPGEQRDHPDRPQLRLHEQGLGRGEPRGDRPLPPRPGPGDPVHRKQQGPGGPAGRPLPAPGPRADGGTDDQGGLHHEPDRRFRRQCPARHRPAARHGQAGQGGDAGPGGSGPTRCAAWRRSG